MANARRPGFVQVLIFTLLLLSCSQTGKVHAQEGIAGTLYINTLHGDVYQWDIPSTSLGLVTRYDYQIENLPGWTFTAFSDNGQKLAYVRADHERRWIGVSPLDNWQPVELLIDVPVTYEKVYLNWLPDNERIIVSYLVDIPQGSRQPAMFNTLVGRQIFEAGSHPDRDARLIDWPYSCNELTEIARTEPKLRCNLNANLVQEWNHEVLPPVLAYQFGQEGELLQSASSNEIGFPVDDFIYPNWVWSEQSGFAFFSNGLEMSPPGVYWLSPHSLQPEYLATPATSFMNLTWSPDGTRLLIQDNDPRIWHFYDLSLKQVVESLEINDLNFQTELTWFHDSNHYAYVIQDRDRSVIHVASLLSNQEYSIALDYPVTAIAWRRDKISD